MPHGQREIGHGVAMAWQPAQQLVGKRFQHPVLPSLSHCCPDVCPLSPFEWHGMYD